MANDESSSDTTDTSAKPAKKQAAKAPASRRAASPPGPLIVIGHKLLKLVGVVAGLPAAVICVMALIGGVTESGYVRFFGALVLVLGVPLFIADRLLPNHNPMRARGLVSDVVAVSWTLTTFVIAGALGGMTRPMIGREGDRIVRAGYPDVARGAYLLAGLDATIPSPEPAPVASASAPASAAASASASSSAE